VSCTLKLTQDRSDLLNFNSSRSRRGQRQVQEIHDPSPVAAAADADGDMADVDTANGDTQMNDDDGSC
jgi:hypothetical protein